MAEVLSGAEGKELEGEASENVKAQEAKERERRRQRIVMGDFFMRVGPSCFRERTNYKKRRK